MTTIFGHETQRQALERLFRKALIPSTLLFAGPEGVGKRLVALELARALLCTKGEAQYRNNTCDCSSCHLIRAHHHPDLFRVECGDTDRWGTEGIRSLLHSLSLTSFTGAGRVIIFNNAEELHLSSANALLKSLEEPRPRTWYILISKAPNQLPQTIRSRSQVWFFNQLSERDTNDALTQMNLAPLTAYSPEDLLTLTDGAPGTAMTLTDHHPLWGEVCEALPEIYDGDSLRASKLAQKYAKDKETIAVLLRFIRSFARRALTTQKHPLLKDSRWATCVANSLTSERLITERNINPLITLLNLFLSISPAPEQPHGTLIKEL